jgi:hypothetical protein
MANMYYGRSEGGSIKLDRKEDFASLIHSLDGKQIQLTLEERTDPDDIGQMRRYFHGFVLPQIAAAAGYSNDPRELARVKQGLKERFLTVPAAPGDPVEVRSTESLSKSEYALFIFHCRRYAAETLHVDIEDPQKLSVNSN